MQHLLHRVHINTNEQPLLTSTSTAPPHHATVSLSKSGNSATATSRQAFKTSLGITETQGMMPIKSSPAPKKNIYT